MRAGASRSRAPAGKFRRLKIGIGDRALKTAATRPVPSVSNFRVRRGPQNAGSAPHMAKSPNSENAWLGREDSNLRMAESKSAALPLGYAPMRRKARAALAESGRTIVPGVPRRNARAGRNLLRLDTAAGSDHSQSA